MNHSERTSPPTAVVTGASAGLGRAVARGLARRGWRLIIDGRRADLLADAAAELNRYRDVVAVPGDVADAGHRAELVAAAGDRLDLMINNASELGGSPLPPLRELSPGSLHRLWQVNVAAPLALIQTALPIMVTGSAMITISSDAAVEHYPTWGGYGASKAALDHLTLTLAAEQPDLRWYAVDPGDLRTAMHQAAFPGEDISDRPDPETVVPALFALIDSDLPSGRYRTSQLPELTGSDRPSNEPVGVAR